jgi:hypothetical protein
VWWNGLNWNELDDEKELCVGEWCDACSYTLLDESLEDESILAEISPVSGGMARMGSFKTKPFCDIR